MPLINVIIRNMKVVIDTSTLQTIDQAATQLKVARMTIYRWLKEERICGVKIGNKTLFPQSEIDRILKTDTDLTKAMKDGKV